MSIEQLEAERAQLIKRIRHDAATQERTLRQRFLPAAEADLTMLRALSIHLAKDI